MDAVPAVQTAITFVWLGMVLGISFLEAPIKFRAPGITIELGVGIGRLVFRALNIVECVFALVLIASLALAWPPAPLTVSLVVALVVVLTIGAGVLRPRMDARVRRGTISDGQPRHALHIGFVALELLKVVLLLVLGISLLVG
jgi:asparagine N-glycosylation enzyme membrane subunit Stt3